MSLKDDLNNVYLQRVARMRQQEEERLAEQRRGTIQKAQEDEVQEWERARQVVANLHGVMVGLAEADKSNCRQGEIFVSERVKTTDHSVSRWEKMFGLALPPDSVPSYICDEHLFGCSHDPCKKATLTSYTTFQIPESVMFVVCECQKAGISVSLQLGTAGASRWKGASGFSYIDHYPAKVKVVARW